MEQDPEGAQKFDLACGWFKLPFRQPCREWSRMKNTSGVIIVLTISKALSLNEYHLGVCEWIENRIVSSKMRGMRQKSGRFEEG